MVASQGFVGAEDATGEDKKDRVFAEVQNRGVGRHNGEHAAHRLDSFILPWDEDILGLKATNRAGIAEDDLKYNLTSVLQIQADSDSERLKRRKLAIVKVSALALKELTSVPYYVRFFICNMGIVIAMSHCVVKYRHVQQEIMKLSVDVAVAYLRRKLLFTENGVDLQVCTSKNPTCCTKKMEERYQTAAKQDIEQVLQTSSATLKFLISHNAAAFQETFEMLIRLAENYTSTLFCNAYRNMAAEATTRVQEFFTDVGLFIFGTDISTEEFVNRFFDTLFPVVYNHVINPGLTDISLEYAECLRMARRDIRPFGNIPKKAIGQMGRSLLPSRTFLQALNLGIEVINTTDHLHFSKDCSRALLRMQYCPHCQGLTLSKPCMGYCLNVIRGCLANVAEVDLHWRGYIQSLEELSSAMSGMYDIEHVLLNFHSLVNDALIQAHINGPELSEQVNKVCGPPVRKPTQSPGCSFDQNNDNQGLKMFSRDSEATLANRRKEFISHLRLYRAFYGGLADQLCGNELAAADGLPCWNGEDVVRSYTHRVVGSGIKAQSANPEVKVKGTDPVISQIIDKLKHVIQ
ncbi:PREDICTED: glypican-5-like, partial [Nipponia nippon]|uniref:glypican-5-like n=1 Tax=Nipponia nippon TaxID=128390 RepID=UPI0005114E62